VAFNFVRRQRIPLLVLTVVVFWFLINRIQRNTAPHSFEQLTNVYCNAPHEVTGDERENVGNGLKLVQVQMLIRHGDRAPVDLKALPNTSPVHISCRLNGSDVRFNSRLQRYKNVVDHGVFNVEGSKHTNLIEERSVCYGGQLTPRGMLQHLYLGSHLRSSYQSFLQTVDINKHVHVLSTDLPRTKQSAAALLIGMFYEILLRDTKTKITINVHKDHLLDSHLVLDEHEDPLSCHALKEKWRTLLTGHEFERFNKNTRVVVENIAYYLSVDADSLPKYNRIVDTFYTRACHNLGIPKGPKHTLPLSLIEQSFGFAHQYSTLRHSGEIAELQTLSLLSQIAKQSVYMLRGEEDLKKVVVYSGHDSMIHPFLQILNDNFIKWPPYASRIVFELYADSTVAIGDKEAIKKAFFRILYNGEPVTYIKFLGKANGAMKLYPLSDLLLHVMLNGRDDFYKNEITNLSELLFTRIQALCEK